MERPHLLNSYPKQLDGTCYFHQDDPQWADRLYTVCDNPGQTISSSGCMPTWQAMLIKSLAGFDMNPQAMAEFNVDKGFRTQDSGTLHRAVFALQLFGGIRTVEIIPSEVGTALELGGLVTVSGRLTEHSRETLPGTRTGHIYGIRRMEGGMVWVNDPKSLEKSVTSHSFDELLPTFNKLYASFRPSMPAQRYAA